MENRAENGVLEEFRIEFLRFWQWLPNKGAFLALLACWFLLFQFFGHCTLGYLKEEYRSPSLFVWLYDSFGGGGNPLDGDEATGVFAPLLVLGILWWRRKDFMALQPAAWWPGLAIIVFGLALHVVGYRIQQPRVSVVGLFTGIYGLVGIAWGPAFLRASIFPFFLFAFCVPLASLSLPITFRLRVLVCKLVEGICGNLLAIDIIRDGTRLLDPSGRFSYDVAAACSGIRSLMTILLLTLVYAFMDFKSWWRRLAIVASAFPLAVLGNTCRMLLIVIVSEIWGQRQGQYVHDNAYISLTPYIPAIAGVLVLGHWLREPPPKTASAPNESKLATA